MATPKKQFVLDNSFYTLANDITKAINRNKRDKSTQKDQLEALLAAEIKFKKEALKHKVLSREVYKKFLQKITIINRNILSARPYFRESGVDFSKFITPAIKAGDIAKMQTFTINFQMIDFIKNNWKVDFDEKLEKLYQKVKDARRILIENNIPLAINRAKLFYRKTPRSHLDLMDLIVISCQGLAIGVDKWSKPTWNPSFNPMVIGRMIGVTIENYSQTTLHFFPNDRKVLYRANSLRGRLGIKDVAELTDVVNKSFEEDRRNGMSAIPPKVTVAQLSELLQGASTVSADAVCNEEGQNVHEYTPSEELGQEEQFALKEEKDSVYLAARNLSVIKKKILRLKGLRF